MKEQALITLVTILLPLIGGGIGFLFKRYLDKQKELFNEVAKERRQSYQDFINLIIDIFSADKIGGKTLKTEDHVAKLYQFYKKNILFAPPKIVNAFGDYMQYLYTLEKNEDPKRYQVHILKLTRVMKEMRHDLGLTNTDLGEGGERLMRAMIKDFDQLMYK